MLTWWVLGLAALIGYRTVVSGPDWKAFVRTLRIEPEASSIAFCKELGILADPTSTKSALAFVDWALAHHQKGLCILIDSIILKGVLPTYPSLVRAYAVDPSRRKELLKNGLFVEYVP